MLKHKAAIKAAAAQCLEASMSRAPTLTLAMPSLFIFCLAQVCRIKPLVVFFYFAPALSCVIHDNMMGCASLLCTDLRVPSFTVVQQCTCIVLHCFAPLLTDQASLLFTTTRLSSFTPLHHCLCLKLHCFSPVHTYRAPLCTGVLREAADAGDRFG